VEESGVKWSMERLDKGARNVQDVQTPYHKTFPLSNLYFQAVEYTIQTSICQTFIAKKPYTNLLEMSN
jgi:hypothetical protein